MSKGDKYSPRITKKESSYVFPSLQVSVLYNILKWPLHRFRNQSQHMVKSRLTPFELMEKGTSETWTHFYVLCLSTKKRLLETLQSSVGQYLDHSKYSVISAAWMHNQVCLLTPDLWKSHHGSCKTHRISFGTYHVDWWKTNKPFLVLLILSVKTSLLWHPIACIRNLLSPLMNTVDVGNCSALLQLNFHGSLKGVVGIHIIEAPVLGKPQVQPLKGKLLLD